METPTEWSVESRQHSPPPLQVRETSRASTPVAVERLRPPSQGSARREGDRAASASPSRPASREVKERAHTLAQYLSYPSDPAQVAKEAAMQVELESKTSSFMASLTTAPTRVRTSPPGTHPKRITHDALAAEGSIESLGTLPPQDSTSSTVASFPRAATSKPLQSRASASRGAQGRYSPSSSAGFGNNTLRANLPASPGLGSKVPPATAPLKASASEFSPALGFGDRAPITRSTTPQVPRGMSPKPALQRRMMTAEAGGQRELIWGSRSTGSLPLTNAAGRNTHSKLATPQKQQRRRNSGGDEKTAKLELAAAQSEGHLPELLPAFKPGRIHKGPKTPTWLVAV